MNTLFLVLAISFSGTMSASNPYDANSSYSLSSYSYNDIKYCYKKRRLLNTSESEDDSFQSCVFKFTNTPPVNLFKKDFYSDFAYT